MSTVASTTRAIAVDLRESATGALRGVALLVPSEQYASVMIIGGSGAQPRPLADRLWRDIETWIATGDAGLPSRPAPLGREIAEVLFDGRPGSMVAQRSASIPLPSASHENLARLAQRLLSKLVSAH